MKVTTETLNIIFFLLPGLISLIIINACLVKKVINLFDKVILSLIFSSINFLIINKCFNEWNFVYLEKIDSFYSIKITNYYLSTYIILLSILLALVVSLIINKDIHMRVLRYFHITSLTSRNSTWIDVFEEEKRYILVHLKDGRMIQGYPKYYSTNDDEERVYLTNAKWFEDDGSFIECSSSSGILINGNIELIEFLLNENEGEKNGK